MSQYDKQIFDFLTEKLGNEIGAAALMGNLYVESKLDPVCLEGSYSRKHGISSNAYTILLDSGGDTTIDYLVRDGAGYGLAQWTYWSRKKALVEYARKLNKSVGDIDVQLGYLWEEIQKYKKVLPALQNATDLRTTSDVVCLEYEKPQHTEEKYLQNRANYGQKFYDEYAKKEENSMVKMNDWWPYIQGPFDDRWGYIYGSSGEKWTAAKQEALVKKYNSDTVKYKDLKISAQAGGKWIGKYVIDCSGMPYRAFSKCSVKIAHGSNSIWRGYLSHKGKISSGMKLPKGTAIFTGDDNNKPHIGTYDGEEWVIEAQGTNAGVTRTRLTNSKWKYWGLYKDLEYDFVPGETETKPSNGSSGVTVTYPTIRQGSKGEVVTQLQLLLSKAGSSLVVDGIFGSGTASAVRAFQKKYGLQVDGIVGPKTWTKLLEVAGNIQVSEPVKEELVTIIIPDITKSEAEELMKKYPRAEKVVISD